VLEEVSEERMKTSRCVAVACACLTVGGCGSTSEETGDAKVDAGGADSFADVVVDVGADNSFNLDVPSFDARTPPAVSAFFDCKLINGATTRDPTTNHLQTRFNLTGTDLGIPLAIGSDLHLFFGDTMGYEEIWPPGQDPDSVAHISLGEAKTDFTTLCRDLGVYVTPDDPSVAHATDPTVLRDFAGAYMTPPPGGSLDQYIAQHPPGYPNIPGTFEVPTGAIFSGGNAYVFYAGLVTKTPSTFATLSYLAKWSAPGAAVPGYQIVRPIDRLVGGDLGGHFIQIAPVESAGTLYLFGTGQYRHSGVRLARKPIADIESAGGEELFDPASGTWKAAASMTQSEREAIAPLVEGADGVGEISVQWFADASEYVMLYQRELHDASGAIFDNRVVLRTAKTPEGPWTDAATIFDMADATFRSMYCCGATCAPDQILQCDRAGLYGAYLLPFDRYIPGGQDKPPSVQIPFLVSTWDPYGVVLFHLQFDVD
jgi:hypothetical protein